MDSDRHDHPADSDQRPTTHRPPFAFVPRRHPRTPLARPEPVFPGPATPTPARPGPTTAQTRSGRSKWPTRDEWLVGATVATAYCILVYGMLALCLS